MAMTLEQWRTANHAAVLKIAADLRLSPETRVKAEYALKVRAKLETAKAARAGRQQP